jgi:8-oxo-dGTP pyrophosphatase MutT (NUDIX family)
MSDKPASPENINQLAEYLTKVNRDRSTPNMRPKNAATLILLDHSGKVPKVLMGKRHAGHKFMPGKFVFPGGRIEATDRQMNVAGALSPIVEEKLNKRVKRPSSIRPRALALAAIRETFEETGILLGTKEYGAAIAPPPGPWTDFVGHGVLPNLENLHFIARAITPPRRPKRFDTAFFSMDASEIAHTIEGVVTADTELVELVWIPLPEARTLDLPPITGVVLKELEQRIAGGMRHELPVPFFYEIRKKWQREEL